MRIYVAGPMSGLPEFNFPAFNAVAAQLRDEGHEVFNPADNGGDTTESWEYYMRLALRMVLECEAVMLLPGWSNSRGATLERQVALALGMRVYEWPSRNRVEA